MCRTADVTPPCLLSVVNSYDFMLGVGSCVSPPPAAPLHANLYHGQIFLRRIKQIITFKSQNVSKKLFRWGMNLSLDSEGDMWFLRKGRAALGRVEHQQHQDTLPQTLAANDRKQTGESQGVTVTSHPATCYCRCFHKYWLERTVSLFTVFTFTLQQTHSCCVIIGQD